MLLKTIIILLLIANIIALGTAFYAMMTDMGSSEGTRTAKFLTVRVSLAALLLVVVAYGIITGDLGLAAPWHPAATP
ncbi:MAG: hypothetical protein CBC55_12415 [Gammaproteobacteria bacterium TMED95]|jgi:hypothetical protein|nr:hypothetical protein [Gammaproteobacteria bacterium]OUV19221.1 MAG: hypothetical protein CBC55_12415 [Gammaproteobacteria bacterium TMED95]|tara:strand:- start:723 stop:953 length:231 start_codon:yes stop_codon:yes gene_type:complete